MELVGAVGLASTILGVVSTVAVQVMEIKRLHDQIKTADAQLMSFIAQLNTIKAALMQIQELLKTTNYDDQLEMDLELALQASQLHLNFIDSKMTTLKTKNAATTLRFRSKVKMVFESQDMDACLQRLSHQSMALNLLITVLMSKSLTEQKNMLQRNNTRKVFKQIQEDKASLLDETASMDVLRDHDSVRNAMVRIKSEPIIAKNPWKRFTFDSQISGSKAYASKLLRRQVSENNVITEDPDEIDSESTLDDAATLVSESEKQINDMIKPKLDLEIGEDANTAPPRFSKMLAFGNTQRDVSNLVVHAQHLWNAQDNYKSAQSTTGKRAAQTHRLTTKYFDVSILAHTLEEYSEHDRSEELLFRYRDVSSILFVLNLAAYQYDNNRLSRDLNLFANTAKDYNLWLAKIIIFLDTAHLDRYSAHGISEDIKQKFMQAGRAGVNEDRIHVVVGQADEMAAGTIFAVCNESERVQENKWAGLTKSPTY